MVIWSRSVSERNDFRIPSPTPPPPPPLSRPSVNCLRCFCAIVLRHTPLAQLQISAYTHVLFASHTILALCSCISYRLAHACAPHIVCKPCASAGHRPLAQPDPLPDTGECILCVCLKVRHGRACGPELSNDVLSALTCGEVLCDICQQRADQTCPIGRRATEHGRKLVAIGLDVLPGGVGALRADGCNRSHKACNVL